MPRADTRPPPAGEMPREHDITVDKIVDSLREQIVGGDLAPGASINSVALARQFGSSRTPVREALLVLNQHGLVSLAAHRRPRVAEVSLKSIRDLYALRTALHDYLSAAIVDKASDPQLRQLHEQAALLAERFPRQSTEQHLRAVEDYLALEVAAADNAAVAGVLDSLRWRIAWYRRLGALSREQLQALARDRVRAADAYVDRDTSLAQALNRAMLKKAGAACEQRFMQGQPGAD